MKRGGVGRNAGLSVRMAVAMLLLLATYAGIVFGLVLLVAYRPSYTWLWIAALVALATSLAARYRGGGDAVLRSIGAHVARDRSDVGLRDVVARLASLADISVPEVAIAETDAPNALAVGYRRASSTLVVTRGLIAALEPAELEAVVAHEIAHLANRDAAVMTAVSAPRVLGEVVVGGAVTETRGLVWMLFWPLGLLPLGIGTALTLTVSRYREFAADRGSALLTGAPEQLMSALLKISGHAAQIPHEDLRVANAFCIVSTEAQRFALFADHPPMEKRLAALAQIAREMGRPVSG